MKALDQSLHVVGAALVEGTTCLAVRRGPTMSTPNKWEFPGGKVEAGESPRAALRREILEELDLEIVVGELLGRGTVVQGERTLHLDVYLAKRATSSSGVSEVIRLKEHSEQRWLTADRLHEVDWAAADIPILPQLRAQLMEAASKTHPGSAERAPAGPGSGLL